MPNGGSTGPDVSIKDRAAAREQSDRARQGKIETLIPARLERLPWGRFHVLVVAALGITWILDGLEVTLAGSVAGALKASPALHFSDSAVGFAASAYLSGAVCGALFFGWLTDRLGRKVLFFTTIAVYLTATALTGTAWNGASFFLFRFFTGAGIGGEYAAVNSTIQELIPARYRGRLDLMVNGSFWVGAALGALVAVALLNPRFLSPELGWRLAFLTGAVLGLVVFGMRMWIPESPRWLAIHGREDEGEAVVAGIEQRFRNEGEILSDVPRDAAIRLTPRTHTPLSEAFDRPVRHLSSARAGRACADGRAGVLLQRDLLHLRACPDEVLRRRLRRRRLVHPAVRARQLPGPRGARAACSTRSGGGR